MFCFFFKSCIRETSTLSVCADSTRNNRKSRLFDSFLHFWTLFSYFCMLAHFVTFLSLFGIFSLKEIIYHILRVTCHLPPVTNANSDRPSPADSPIIHSVLVPDPIKSQINHGQKTLLISSYLLNRSCI